MKKILFICSGNTCRSPMAESILKSKLKERNITNIQCSSAGDDADEGEPVSDNAKEALRRLGYQPRAGTSKLVSRAMMEAYDMILCMTRGHKNSVARYGHKNLYTLAEYTSTEDVVDPYGESVEVYTETARQIEAAMDILIGKLQ
jgi:protein-tyrosine phosphatase